MTGLVVRQVGAVTPVERQLLQVSKRTPRVRAPFIKGLASPTTGHRYCCGAAEAQSVDFMVRATFVYILRA